MQIEFDENDEIWTNWSNGKFSLQIILQILYTWINFTSCLFNCDLLIFAFAKLNTDGGNKKKKHVNIGLRYKLCNICPLEKTDENNMLH